MNCNFHRFLGLSLRVLAALGVISAAITASAQEGFTQDGRAGFVVSHIKYALAEDADKTGACPTGMTEGYASAGEVFVNAPELAQLEGEKEQDHVRRIFRAAFSDTEIKNLCQNPEMGKPNPSFKTVTGPNVIVSGIDLDGVNSDGGDKPGRGSCKHEDFAGMNGETGIDNQMYRVVGCSKSYQSTGQSNTWDIVMYTGAWGILITLDGLDDIRNDDSVEVGFYANSDPMQLSPTREALPYSTYAIEQDPRYRATAKGRIVDGVLTTDPVDMRFHWIVNSIRLDRPLEDARVRLTLSEDGKLEGYLGGYTNVEDLYNFKYGFRNGTDGTGQLAPIRLRAGSSIGQARVLGHTCEGAYYALYEHADANPDPDTGRCTAISIQYKIEAIPAFVVDTETQSLNEELDEAGNRRPVGY
ncbi:MAG: hypothetical protein ACI9GW_001472 [Halieaceae bacterium]|jgi:hypothetical protein